MQADPAKGERQRLKGRDLAATLRSRANSTPPVPILWASVSPAKTSRRALPGIAALSHIPAGGEASDADKLDALHIEVPLQQLIGRHGSRTHNDSLRPPPLAG